MPQRTPPSARVPSGRTPWSEALVRRVVARPWRVVCAAAVTGLLCVLAAVGGTGAFSSGGYIASGTEAVRAEGELARRFDAPVPDVVLLARFPGPATGRPAAALGRALTREAAGRPGVREALSYWTTGQERLLSGDHRSALITLDLRGDENQAARTAAALVPHLTRHRPGVEVSATGTAWVMAQATQLSRTELLRAELIGAPLTALVLLLAFGSVAAALLPVLIGALAVAGAFAVLRVVLLFMPVSVFAANVTTALGFGLAVDYALFVVTRYREERGTHADPAECVVLALRTVGRCVRYSAATVVLCLSTLLLFPVGFLRSLTVAGVSVVVCAALATVLVLPALLVLLGDRLVGGDLFARLRRGPADGSALWSRIARAATARPLWAALGAVVLLATLALPFAQVRFGATDERVLPAATESHATARRVEAEFDLPWNRTLAVVLPHVDALEQADRLDAYATRVSALGDVREVVTGTGTYREGRQVAQAGPDSLPFVAEGASWLAVLPAHGPAHDRALVERLRALPAPGGGARVAGRPARVLDTQDAVLGALPLAGTLIVAGVLLLLFLFTGSVLIPLKTVLTGAVSLGASFGAMVWVFQEGHLRGLLGHFTVTGELETSVPVLMFAVAFALSVDYELFLVSRVEEGYRRHGDHRAAVLGAVSSTGRVITAAAAVVAVALLPLAGSGITLLKLMGCGLALAVLVDATVVRGVLVPALLVLTGTANWWAPRGLARLRGRLGLDTWHRAVAAQSPGPALPVPHASAPERADTAGQTSSAPPTR
ncbi:MMPL family transporter [Streptomyces sp. LP11]|uniref:MMPL family transporter n=1 Tax=Streptomyces pyxinicus TaxID=2970331 RepID=A0ABT2B3I1_9ACTN|nr:MMPL family transporter [Streptomyces sp. LP11]MCS0603052.1 MMPL family transporter [Streptomyces sp. LP11]